MKPCVSLPYSSLWIFSIFFTKIINGIQSKFWISLISIAFVLSKLHLHACFTLHLPWKMRRSASNYFSLTGPSRYKIFQEIPINIEVCSFSFGRALWNIHFHNICRSKRCNKHKLQVARQHCLQAAMLSSSWCGKIRSVLLALSRTHNL